MKKKKSRKQRGELSKYYILHLLIASNNNNRDQSYMEKENQLIAELEWIKEIAQKIDTENHSLMKKYMDLKAQYSTQENDREILLRHLKHVNSNLELTQP